MHVKVLYGRSSHHHIEAVFKAFARALRVACAKDAPAGADAARARRGCCDAIALIDYGAGNLTSVRKALAAVGADVFTPDDAGGARGARRARRARRRPLRGDRGARRALARRHPRARRNRARRSSASASGCSGSSRAATRRPAAGARPAAPAAAGGSGPTATRPCNSRPRSGPTSRCRTSAGTRSTPSGRRTILHGRAGRRAGLLHALVRRAGDARPASRRPRTAQHVRQRRRARTRLRRAVPPREVGRRGAGARELLRATSAGGTVVGSAVDCCPKRIIACLDVRDGQVVKGVKFEELRAGRRSGRAGRAATTSRASTSSSSSTSPPRSRARRALAETISRGGARALHPARRRRRHPTEADAAAAVDAGADKVSLNTAALADPGLITTLAERYGSQAVDRRDRREARGRRLRGLRAQRHDGRRRATPSSGRARPTARGAGEILLTSIDRDGTRAASTAS